jgi:hypothetical protein
MLVLSKFIVILTFFTIFCIPKALIVSLTGLRPEDFIGLIAILSLPIFFVNTYRNISSKLNISIIVYFLYLFIISSIRTPQHIPSFSVLLFKEVSYVSCFFVFYYTFYKINLKEIKPFLKKIIFLSTPAIIYGLFQILTFNFTGMYGLSLYGHEKSPASNGLIYLFIFLIFFIFKDIEKRSKALLFLINILGLLVILTGSKLSALGLFTFLLVYYFLDEKFYRKLGAVSFIPLVLTIMYFVVNSGIGALHRYSSLLTPIALIQNRGIWFKLKWSEGFFAKIAGMGLSAGHIDIFGDFSFGMAMDNFYLYCLIVYGLVGSIIFFLMIWSLIQNFPKKFNEKKIAISITLAFLVMGMGAEIFQLSISGILFWSLSGMLLGIAKNKIIHSSLLINNKIF